MVRQTGDALPKGPLWALPALSLSDALPAYAFPPQLAQYGGGMYVYDSDDVSLESARFSECTADVRLPRPHTLASPAHARSHAIAAPEAGEEGRGTWFGKRGTPSPKGPLWALPALSRSLTPYLLNAFPPQLAQYGGGMSVQNSGDVALEGASVVRCTSGVKAVRRAPSTRGCTD